MSIVGKVTALSPVKWTHDKPQFLLQLNLTYKRKSIAVPPYPDFPPPAELLLSYRSPHPRARHERSLFWCYSASVNAHVGTPVW